MRIALSSFSSLVACPYKRLSSTQQETVSKARSDLSTSTFVRSILQYSLASPLIQSYYYMTDCRHLNHTSAYFLALGKISYVFIYIMISCLSHLLIPNWGHANAILITLRPPSCTLVLFCSCLSINQSTHSSRNQFGTNR